MSPNGLPSRSAECEHGIDAYYNCPECDGHSATAALPTCDDHGPHFGDCDNEGHRMPVSAAPESGTRPEWRGDHIPPEPRMECPNCNGWGLVPAPPAKAEPLRPLEESLRLYFESHLPKDEATRATFAMQACLKNREELEAQAGSAEELDPDKFQWNPNKCCGDAHMELESAMEHFKLLGFEIETKEGDGFIEKIWHNRPAEEASSRLAAKDAEIKRIKQELSQLREHCISEHDCSFCALAGEGKVGQ